MLCPYVCVCVPAVPVNPWPTPGPTYVPKAVPCTSPTRATGVALELYPHPLRLRASVVARCPRGVYLGFTLWDDVAYLSSAPPPPTHTHYLAPWQPPAP
jgi:hypothetical protein